MRQSILVALGLLVYLALVSGAAANQEPTEFPIFEQVQDINPCTGEPITLTFSGVALVHEFDGHYHLHGFGTVTTSDGYSGTFNRQFVFKGDTVVTLRFHDMEINTATGQRVMFAVGLFHVTMVDGEPTSSVLHFSGLRCVGVPQP